MENGANSTMNKAVTWVKTNPLIAGAGALALTLLFFPRILRTPTRRKRRYYKSSPVRRRRTTGVRRSYTKGGKTKKPWQIKGSPAAKRYMARIRRMR